MSDHDSHDTHDNHPGPKTYIIVGVILAIVTLIELAITSPPVLLALTVVKAGLVAMYFMHLKMDRFLYTFFFCIGIFVLAIPFTIVMLVLM